MKIQNKFLFFTLLIVIIMAALTFIIIRFVSINIVKDQIENHLRAIVQSTAHHIETTIDEYKGLTVMISTGNAFKDIADKNKDHTQSLKQISRRIKSVIQSHKEISRIRVLDNKGIIIASSHIDVGLDKRNDDIFLNGKNGVYFGEVHISKYTGDKVLSIAAPIKLADVFAALIVVNYNIDELIRITTEKTGLGESGEIYIVNKNGYMITPSRFIDDTFLKQKVNTPEADLCFKMHLKNGIPESPEEKPTSYLNYSGREVLGTHCYLPQMKWCLIAEISIEEAYKPIFMLSTLITAIFIFILAACIILVIITSKTVTKPIVKLNKGIEEVISGNLDFKTGTKANDEIGQLSRSFDRMTENLKISKKKLEEYSKDLEKKIEDRTAELKEQFENSQRQKNAIMNIAQDMEEVNINLKTEIDERKRIVEALRQSEEQKRVILDGSPDVIVQIDANLKIAWANKAALDINPDAVNRFCYNALNDRDEPCEDCPCVRALETNQVEKSILHYKDLPGSHGESYWEVIGAPLKGNSGNISGVIRIARDITERRRIEEEIQKAQRIESIGVLAGGIAHDFNNLLAIILGNAQLAILKPEGDIAFTKYLQNIEEGIDRATALTQQLLTFSKGGAPVTKTSSIVSLLKESVKFALSGSNAKCELSIPEDILPVDIDKGQIHQVINNIIINADQAMPEGGIINVLVENIKGANEKNLLLKNIKYVKITIKDTGVGVPKEHLQKVFDPYYTTKTKGSGLGLATAYSIIKKHEGFILVDSELGVGTCFTIYLPASEKDIYKEKHKQVKGAAAEGRILVMDDEELIRELCGTILEKLGYEVEYAEEGGKAVDLYKKAKDSAKPFDAVIMDLTIPGGMGGKKAVRKVLEIDPEAKVIVASGYSNDPVLAEYKKYGFAGIITKPFKIEEISEAVLPVINKKKA
jgi:signal transduction histidine kinase/ActR/RegA family two-component response regulator